MRPGDEVAFSWDQLAKNSSTRLKKTPKTTQVTEFESDLFKTNDNTALESRGILQKFVARGKFVPHFCEISRLCGAIGTLRFIDTTATRTL